MPIIKLVISDLHLADGHPILDGFGASQQSALHGLLNAASGDGSLGDADDVELIINGDCFDFMMMKPYEMHTTTNPSTALAKLEKVIVAHRPFFKALQGFISVPGRHVTFIAGNHDVELGFEEVQTRIREVIWEERGRAEEVNFCHARFYRPLPDVHIEHGNEYDFWNRLYDFWDDQGQPLTLKPETITLPLGTQYIQRAAYPINVLYPYFDHFEPSMNLTHQLALLCFLNPEIVVETVHHVMEMLSYSHKPLAGLSPGEEHIPLGLFEHAMIDFAAFQQEMLARSPDFIEPPGQETTQTGAMLEFMAVHEGMSLPVIEAIKIICTPAIYQMAESLAKGMQGVLHNDPTLSYAIAGHTHMDRADPSSDRSQVYLNSGTWTTRYALPAPSEMTAELVEWLRRPDWSAIPLRDMTRFVFVFIHAEEGAPSSARLCAWEGGIEGAYRVVA